MNASLIQRLMLKYDDMINGDCYVFIFQQTKVHAIRRGGLREVYFFSPDYREPVMEQVISGPLDFTLSTGTGTGYRLCLFQLQVRRMF